MTTAITRYRRTPVKEPTLRLICFPLRQAYFCVPLAAAHRVVFRPAPEADRSPGFVQVQGEAIAVVDIAPWLYQEAPLLPGLGGNPAAGNSAAIAPADQTILVVNTPRLGRLGLRVDATPALKRARQSAFAPVPPVYLITHRLRGVHTLVNLSGEPPIFVLDVDRILLAEPGLA